MDNLVALQAPLVALAAGLFASLHCLGMCGPIACGALARSEAKLSRMAGLAAAYSAGRVVAYCAVGALAGSIGAGLIQFAGSTPARILPWLFLAFFAAILLGLDRKLGRISFFKAPARNLTLRLFQLPPWQRSLGLGLATPLLPCGPLYLIAMASAGAGNALGGAAIMLFFCLGTAPALCASLVGWSWLNGRLSPACTRRLQIGIASLAFLLIFSRALVRFDQTGQFVLCF